MTTRESRAASASPVVLRYHITRKGIEFIDKLRSLTEDSELSDVLTNAASALVSLARERDPNIPIPPEYDFFFKSAAYPEGVDSGFFSEKLLEQSEGLFEIEMPDEFYESVRQLQKVCTYKSTDAAVRHVLLFAHYCAQQTREPGFVH